MTYVQTAFTACSLALVGCMMAAAPHEEVPKGPAAQIKKLGTIDAHLVETSPVVFHDKLYRFESVRTKYQANERGVPYYRFIDVATGEPTPAFAEGHDLGSAYAEGDTMYVFATPGWGSSKINVFSSKDLKNWESHTALDLPGWELFNTSVCKAGNRYVMAFEVGGPPEVAGNRFTGRFAESKDLREWTLLPEPAVYTKDKYSACPTIRWYDGWYYVSYLEAVGGYNFHTYLVRSRDLTTWEDSPMNPVLAYDEHDKKIASDRFTTEQIAEIKEARNINNSDIDYCDFQGEVVIYYSWGNQAGLEYLAEARYDGTLKAFLTGMFPDDEQ